MLSEGRNAAGNTLMVVNVEAGQPQNTSAKQYWNTTSYIIPAHGEEAHTLPSATKAKNTVVVTIIARYRLYTTIRRLPAASAVYRVE